MPRKHIDDNFSKFHEWLTSNGFRANSAKIYCSSARSMDRAAKAAGKDVETYIRDNGKATVFLTAWRSYKKYLSTVEPEVIEYPEEVVLAKLILEKYNQTAKHRVAVL